MAVYYINGTSNSGATFGTSGYFYPLYLTTTEANSATRSNDTVGGTSHAHTFEEAPNITFYMPVEDAAHAQPSAPSGSYSGEAYISYLSPIAEIDVEEIGFGVLAGDTFNSWRKKTNDVARETIANKASIGSVDTRLTRLLSVTGGENNIMTLTSSDNITGEKEFEGLVKFSAADDSANGIQVGANGKIYVESSTFKFTKSIDLHEAGGEIKVSDFDVPTGRTKYAGVQYTWPSQSPIPGQILKSAPGNTLTWATENAAEAQVEAFLIEDPNPIGSVLQWTTNTPPSKWLICDGSAVSRTTYEDLFGVIGETYGAGDGTTTFNLPDLRARVPIGKGTNSDANNLSAAFETLGSSEYVVNNETLQGEYQHTLIENETPIHKHFTATTGSTGTAELQINQGNTNLAIEASMSYRETGTIGSLFDQPNFEYILYGATDTANTGVTSSFGGDQSHNVVQPFIVLNYIIKAEASTVVEQNLLPTGGILINDESATKNLLSASNDPDALGGSNNPNTIKLDVDLNDFEFVNNKLKILENLITPNIVQAINQAATVSVSAPVVGTFIDYPSLEVTITPAFDGSKFLISGDAHMGAYTTGHDYVSKYMYKKNEAGDTSTGTFANFLLPTSPGSRVAGHGVHFSYSDRHDDIGNVKPANLLMTPVNYSVSAGDSFTFKIQVASLYTASSARHYFNRSETDANNSSNARTISQITVQEIRQTP